ncbi:MAG: hypothetical protein QG556_71 [Pseudomonadota bacterium]|nr:hypothetical protein [Pseudomonadota bacterium]
MIHNPPTVQSFFYYHPIRAMTSMIVGSLSVYIVGSLLGLNMMTSIALGLIVSYLNILQMLNAQNQNAPLNPRNS